MDRINKGWSMEKELTVSRRCKSIGKSEKDHLGNVYKDRSSMCEAYGLTMAAYHRRRRRWLTLEEAMTSRKEEADIKMREYRLNAAG